MRDIWGRISFFSENNTSRYLNPCFLVVFLEIPRQVNSEDPEKMLHSVAFYQGLHCFFWIKVIFMD